jgi:hypothetical protein
MGIFRRRPSPGVLVAAVGVLAGLGGIAVATIPDSGVIHGCYSRLTDICGSLSRSATAATTNRRSSGTRGVRKDLQARPDRQGQRALPAAQRTRR